MTRIAERCRRWLATPAVQVLLASGALGIVVALISPIPWPDALEPAQVLAGVVRYPTDSPLYLYSTTTWTLLHQLGAALLAAGVSERGLAMTITAASGLVAFSALALVVWTFSEQRAVSIVAPLLIYFTNGTNASVTYPVALIGSTATYGMIGMSAMMLTIALISSGRPRLGALLLGVLPAIHPTIGGWAWLVISITCLRDRTALGRTTRRAWPWFGAGVMITLLSAAFHFARFPFVQMRPELTTHYIQVFVSYWNSHGYLYGIDRLLAAVGLCAFYVALLRVARPPLSSGAAFVCRCLLTGATIGLALWVIGLLEPIQIVRLARSLMPSRLVNLPVFGGMAIVIGLLARTGTRWAGAMLLVLAASVFDLNLTRVTLSIVVVTITLWAYVTWRGASPYWTSAPPPWMRTAALLLMLVPAPILIYRTVSDRAVDGLLVDRTNNAFFRAVAARSGMLLTGPDLHLIQGLTRRPVLVDGGGMDALGYVPQMGPRLDVILRDVYGIELSAPPQDGPQGTMTADAGRALWTRRTPQEWRAVAAQYGFTDVLTRDDWTLQLPLVANADGLRLYSIPAVGEPR